MISVPHLETERLLLVPLSMNDVKSYTRNFVDYEIIRHLSALVPWPYPENGVRQFFENTTLPRQGIDRWSWGIRLKAVPDEVIGCIDLWREGKPENRGFWLAKRHWGQGLTTEAVAPVMDFAFGAAGFEKLVFANAVGNVRSRRVKEKTGARLVEIKPAKFVDPAYTEHEIWELTKAEWESAKSACARVEISWDKKRLDVETIHGFLKRSSWAAKRSRETLLRSIENSICFGAYSNGRQIGFARVVTDGCTFSYLCDVFVDEDFRGRGVSKAIMANILRHPELQSNRRFVLATKDAHGLYRQFGFRDVEPGRFMEIKNDGV